MSVTGMLVAYEMFLYVITKYTWWTVLYYMALGLQALNYWFHEMFNVQVVLRDAVWYSHHARVSMES